jgi:Cu(I)/Ag(I) efflux system membrane fusion protein
MNRKSIFLFLVMALMALVAGYVAYQWGMRQGMDMSLASSDGMSSNAKATEDPSSWGIAEGEAATRRHIDSKLKAGEIDPVTGQKILYYHDPMVPGKKFETPGKSPYMDMMLVPVYKGSSGGESATDEPGVSITSRLQQNIGMRTALVTKQDIATQVMAVGAIAWNEREEINIQARAVGYVEKLFVQATLDRVKKGQPLLAIYVPDWVAVQEEFLALKNMQGEGLDELVAASIARMRQVGMSEAQIRQVKSTGKLQTQLTINAPIDGVVTELVAREGMTTATGSTLMRINGLDPVWANAEVPESQVALLNPGDPIIASSPAFPGKLFKGQIQRLLPEVEPITRTLKARVVLDNPSGELAPGMFVNMQLAGKQITDALMVPTEALILTGKRTLIMVAMDNGSFRPVEVITGRVADDKTQIQQGLQEGERIIVSGQFLVDSEASLRGVEARLIDGEETKTDDRPMSGMTMAVHQTEAKIEAIDGQILTLTHPEIPSLKWPGMTMDFELSSSLDPDELTVGEQIAIDFRLEEGSAPLIIDMQPLSAETEMEGAQ